MKKNRKTMLVILRTIEQTIIIIIIIKNIKLKNFNLINCY